MATYPDSKDEYRLDIADKEVRITFICKDCNKVVLQVGFASVGEFYGKCKLCKKIRKFTKYN